MLCRIWRLCCCTAFSTACSPSVPMRQTEGLHEGRISRIASPMTSAARSSLWHWRFLALSRITRLIDISRDPSWPLAALYWDCMLRSASVSISRGLTVCAMHNSLWWKRARKSVRELPISTYRRSEGAAFRTSTLKNCEFVRVSKGIVSHSRSEVRHVNLTKRGRRLEML
jgi:hypothetical protein